VSTAHVMIDSMIAMMDQHSVMLDARIKSAMRRGLLDLKQIIPADWSMDVAEFHRAVGAVTQPRPVVIGGDLLAMRKRIMNEEFNEEFIPALDQGDLVGIADGGIDSIVTILGTLLACGIDPRPHWDEVQRTNMAKRDPDTGEVRRRDDGKILKPKGWSPPDLEAILRQQQGRKMEGT
jgi:predicted HAD superfamily Cof-like phosphohydrolase